MKRFSQTLKIVLALFVAVFANGLLPSAVAFATTPDSPPVTDVFVSDIATETESVTEEPIDTVSVDSEAPEVVGENILTPFASPAAYKPPKKVTICHRTASAGNPYVKITVDEDAVNGKGKGDHYLEHIGPIFPLKGADGKWGDIIPPLTGIHSGQNWTDEGQAIYNNDCHVPVVIEVTPGPCAYDGETSFVTINFGGSIKDKDAKLRIKNADTGNVLQSWDIETNRDGDITDPKLPLVYSGLPSGNYVVEIISKRNAVLASEQFSIEECYRTVTPESPKSVDKCYTDKDGIRIKNTEGVVYKVNGEEVSGWVSYEGTPIVVSAEATQGYVIAEGAVTEWEFTFTDEQCITITKTGKVASDTNHNGVIDVGDVVTWEITVTNTSESRCENFYVEVDDANATLENDGYIESLGAGESVTLTATSSISTTDMQQCKISNTATFFGWRANRNQATVSLFSLTSDEEDWLATGSATAVYTLTCPEPGSGSGGSDNTVTKVDKTIAQTPTVLPATGPTENGNPFVVILASIIAYGATYFIQKRRELAVN